MRKILVGLSLAIICCLFGGCGEKQILHCDHCGGEVRARADSGMTEEWILYCGPCNQELFGDDPLLGDG